MLIRCSRGGATGWVGPLHQAKPFHGALTSAATPINSLSFASLNKSSSINYEMVAEWSEGLLDPSLTGNTIKLILLLLVMVGQYFDALFIYKFAPSRKCPSRQWQRYPPDNSLSTSNNASKYFRNFYRKSYLVNSIPTYLVHTLCVC